MKYDSAFVLDPMDTAALTLHLNANLDLETYRPDHPSTAGSDGRAGFGDVDIQVTTIGGLRLSGESVPVR